MTGNAFGLDVSTLDVAAFVATARLAFVVGACAWIFVTWRARRPGWLLAGVLLANAFVWLETNYPLQQLYGLPLSRDRVGNLALCQVVAAGGSPLRTAQLGQLHFEPLWSMLMAVLSGFDADRLLRLYPFMSLLGAMGFAASLYYALRPLTGDDDRRWERAIVAGFATLLASTPFEHTGLYRQPWAMTFLLKPNHALGLVLFPWVLAVFARARGMRGRLAAGVLLHVLGWVFVLHMGYVSCGLVAYAILSYVTSYTERRRDLVDVGVTIGVNALVVSPYIVMLFLGYPFLDRNPLMTIAETSPHLLEVSARVAPWLALAAWGGLVTWRRQDRLSRVWASQLAAAFAIWVGYLALSAVQLARERDEIYYWIRFLTAIFAGIGAWDLLARVLAPRGLAPAARAAILSALALPFSLPYWWDPPRMDPYFPGSRAPLEERLGAALDYLRRETPPGAVVLADGDFARYAAALATRRVLVADNFHQPGDVGERFRMQDAVLTDASGGAAREIAQYGRRWGVESWWVVVTPRWLEASTATRGGVQGRPEWMVTLEEIRSRPHLEERFFWGEAGGEFVAIFRMSPGEDRRQEG